MLLGGGLDSIDGPTPPLTGSESLDLEAVATILSRITGRQIRRVIADDDEWCAGLVAHGVPEGQAQTLLGMFHASRQGEFDVVDPALEKLLGHPPTTLETLLAR